MQSAANTPAHLLHPTPQPQPQPSPQPQPQDIPSALKAAAQQLGGRDVKTRAAAFGVLRALGGVLPAEVAQQLGLIVPGGRGAGVGVGVGVLGVGVGVGG